jgi:DNA-binding transcriptional regulator YhcF (GntR family)
MFKPLPFQLDRQAPEPLSAQIENGIVRAIGSGFYHAGDRLPSLDDMAAGLSVARQTIRVAIGRLVHRGAVVARRKSGILVLDPGRDTFTSHVLHLRRGGTSYYFSTKNERLASRLTGGRIRLSAVDLTDDECRAGMPQVKAVLDGNPVDLAIIDGMDPALEKLCRTHGVPYLAVGRTRDPGAMANLLFDDETPLAALAAYARKQGARSVLLVGRQRSEPAAAAIFRGAGLKTSLLSVRLKNRSGAPQDLEQACFLALRRWLGRSGRRPDLLHFMDDYLARGGLMALAAAGIKVPAQLRVSTLTNRGHHPVFSVSLTQLEVDPSAIGDRIADLAFDLLGTGRPRPDVVLKRASFIAGKSL